MFGLVARAELRESRVVTREGRVQRRGTRVNGSVTWCPTLALIDASSAVVLLRSRSLGFWANDFVVRENSDVSVVARGKFGTQ